jgi:hypothetical protein
MDGALICGADGAILAARHLGDGPDHMTFRKEKERL